MIPIVQMDIPRTFYEFFDMARHLKFGAPGIEIRWHAETALAVRAYDARELAPGGLIERHPDTGQTICGFPVDIDNRVPPGLARFVAVQDKAIGSAGGKMFDLPIFPPAPSDPAGGSLGTLCVCRKCMWHWLAAEGTAPDDALAGANWMAQKHRSETGHGVKVEVTVEWTTAVAAAIRRVSG